MVQLYVQCPNCGNRLFYVKSVAAINIEPDHDLHYCNSCGFQTGFGKQGKNMIYA
ncbi:MAG TPA: hypothetical protein VLD38_03965 [Nitrosopumilaceae archaeon]|nr:hypothetical protein [Nitrosopumilaceae archaeon]